MSTYQNKLYTIIVQPHNSEPGMWASCIEWVMSEEKIREAVSNNNNCDIYFDENGIDPENTSIDECIEALTNDYYSYEVVSVD